ncbi:MAG: VCBS repeat-containing protein [Candidatus Brocadiia bacterium]
MAAPSFEHVVIDTDGPQDPHAKAVGDLDGDGRDELVVASSAGGPLVWYDLETFEKHVIHPAGRWSCDAQVVDMDGDGVPDVLTSRWQDRNEIEWFKNPGGQGRWAENFIGPRRAHDIRVGDLDADGELEIVTRNQGDNGDVIYVYKRAEQDWRRRGIGCPTGEGLVLAPIAGGQRLDIVIGGLWYEAPADSLEGEWTEHRFAEWPEDAVVHPADMNGDGRPDVVLTRSEGPHHISWFEAPDDPRRPDWEEHVIGEDVDYAHSLRVCDLTGDGSLDVITAEMHQSERRRVLVYLNAGDSLSWERRVLAETGSHNVCIADLGGGQKAIAGANWSGPHQPVEMWVVQPQGTAG